MVAGIHAVGLRGDQVRRVDWWEDAGFGDDVRLQAAELVAFDVLEPPLRSRGGIGEAARSQRGFALEARQFLVHH